MLNINLLPWRQAERRRAQWLGGALSLILLSLMLLGFIKHRILSQQLSTLHTTVMMLTSQQQQKHHTTESSESQLFHHLEVRRDIFFKKCQLMFLGVLVTRLELMPDHFLLQAKIPAMQVLPYLMAQAANRQIYVDIHSIKKIDGGFDIVLREK